MTLLDDFNDRLVVAASIDDDVSIVESVKATVVDKPTSLLLLLFGGRSSNPASNNGAGPAAVYYKNNIRFRFDYKPTLKNINQSKDVRRVRCAKWWSTTDRPTSRWSHAIVADSYSAIVASLFVFVFELSDVFKKMLFGVCLPVRAVGDIDRASRESVRNNVPLVDVLQHYADQPQPNCQVMRFSLFCFFRIRWSNDDDKKKKTWRIAINRRFSLRDNARIDSKLNFVFVWVKCL